MASSCMVNWGLKFSRQNQFIQEIIFNNAPVGWIAIAMNTNSVFTGSCTENLFWYQQLDLRQIRILTGGQPIVAFDAADHCRLYVTTRKAMIFQDDMPSIPSDNFKGHYILLFDLTSMQDATEKCLYLEIVGEPLRLELNFFSSRTCYWTHFVARTNVFGCILLGCLWCCWWKNLNWIIFLSSKQLTITHISSIGTVVPFSLTMFQLLIMTFFP